MIQQKRVVVLRFLLDENVDIHLSNFLKEKHCQVFIVPKGIRNGQVIELACKKEAILITNDKDFIQLNKYRKHQGIIVLRIHPPILIKTIPAFEKAIVWLKNKKINNEITFLTENGIEKNV